MRRGVCTTSRMSQYISASSNASSNVSFFVGLSWRLVRISIEPLYSRKGTKSEGLSKQLQCSHACARISRERPGNHCWAHMSHACKWRGQYCSKETFAFMKAPVVHYHAYLGLRISRQKQDARHFGCKAQKEEGTAKPFPSLAREEIGKRFS